MNAIHNMRFFKISNKEDHYLMFFLKILSMEEVRLLPNNKLDVSFNANQDIIMTWSVIIIKSLSYSPISTITGYVIWP
jgi:hypothetical protein